MKITLRELRNGAMFKLNLKGAIWVKLNEQGMNNDLTYARSLERSNTRCQRMSYKHKYLKTDRVVIFCD